MRTRDIAMLSTRMFKTNPGRTWLTILGMGVGTGAVVTLVGLGFGLQNIILNQIVLGDTLLSLNVRNPATKSVVLDVRTVDSFRQIDHIQDVAGMAQLPALITMGGLTGNTFLQGATPAYFKYAGIKEVAGEIFADENVARNRNEVMLSKAVLKLFEIEDPEEAIGRTVTFRVSVPAGVGKTEEIAMPKEYKVVGITNEENFISSFIMLDEYSSTLPVPYYEQVQVRVDETDNLDEVQTKLGLERGFTVTGLSKTVDQARKIFQGIQAVLAVFGGIALVVSAIGMFNTMTVTLLERTSEIGIMRTLGASPNDIRILFISEAIVVGVLGGLVGIGIGVGIGLTLNGAMNVAASKFGGSSVSLFEFPFWFLLFIESFSGIVGFLTGVFPAKRAAGLNPLDAIRYK